MRARWSRQSSEHLRRIRKHIARNNRSAAERVRLRIIETVRQLQRLPRRGRRGRRAGTRQLPVVQLPYIIVYRIDIEDDQIVILGIFHAAQEW